MLPAGEGGSPDLSPKQSIKVVLIAIVLATIGLLGGTTYWWRRRRWP